MHSLQDYSDCGIASVDAESALKRLGLNPVDHDSNLSNNEQKKSIHPYTQKQNRPLGRFCFSLSG